MKIPDIIKQAARELRKNMTEAEKELWKHLRRDVCGYRFLRQKPLYVLTEDSGQDRFIIPDFYCYEKRLVIEVDGGIHQEPETYHLDRQKEYLLEKQEIKVLRFKNEDVLNNIDRVISEIIAKLS